MAKRRSEIHQKNTSVTDKIEAYQNTIQNNR